MRNFRQSLSLKRLENEACYELMVSSSLPFLEIYAENYHTSVYCSSWWCEPGGVGPKSETD